MDASDRRLEFCGVRGTVPTPAADRLGYGGNTTCLAARLADNEYLVIDCGSGVRLLGMEIAKRNAGRPVRIHLLFSHFHFDHIEGLPLFLPMYDRNSEIRIHGVAPGGRSLRGVIEKFLAPPYFPLRIAGSPARIEYVELHGEPFSIGDLKVSTLPLNHPDGCVAYRLERGGNRIVFATDHEHGDPEVDAALTSFARGVDHLIYDATYIPAEYESQRKGWGHSTWRAAVGTARAAGVRNLVLFHHHAEHTDADLEEVLRLARREFPDTLLAREGTGIPL